MFWQGLSEPVSICCWKLGKSDGTCWRRKKGQNCLGIISSKGSKSQSSEHMCLLSAYYLLAPNSLFFLSFCLVILELDCVTISPLPSGAILDFNNRGCKRAKLQQNRGRSFTSWFWGAFFPFSCCWCGCVTVGRDPWVLTCLQVAVTIQYAACCGPAWVNLTLQGRRGISNQNGLVPKVLPQRPSDHGVIMNNKDRHSTRILLHLYSRKTQQQNKLQVWWPTTWLEWPQWRVMALHPLSRPKPVYKFRVPWFKGRKDLVMLPHVYTINLLSGVP